MIEISHLSKNYGPHKAVDNISLNIESGKIYGFLGPNGAGKSTTMNMVTGYISMDEGFVKINGADIAKNPEQAKKYIGYLPEIPPLYVDMTVEEYLNFAAELKRIPKKERLDSVDAAMETTGLIEVADRLIKNLSKGYKQRVGIAQAIIGMPEIIILDEPTVGLDPRQIIEIRELIKNLGKKHTVILSSHILSEIAEVCDHIFVISGGKIVASDTTEGIINAMEEGMEIKLTVKGSTCNLKSELSANADVKEVTENKKENDRYLTTLYIKSAKDTDIREFIFNSCVKNNNVIYEMSVKDMSLEDAFIKLTDGFSLMKDDEEDAANNTETASDSASENVSDSEVSVNSEADLNEESVENMSEKEDSENDSEKEALENKESEEEK